jgi:3'(2'), 5'-bisphosphate nucleotidase
VRTQIDWAEVAPDDCPAAAARDLQAATVAAVAGGLAARPFYQRDDLGITDKGANNPVTDADHAANDAILSILANRMPADPVRSEESAPSPSDVTADRLWVVDPLDGTKEFIAGNGEFAVMVGLASGSAARLGAVLRPDPGRLYLGVVGSGAWVANTSWEGAATNGRVLVGPFRPLRLVATRSADLRMARSRSHPDPLTMAVAAQLGASTIRSGSVGLKCSLIAEGEADVYVHPVPFLREWDTCAPEAVLRGAGGVVSDCRGEPLVYGKQEARQLHGIFAAREDVWDEALPLVREITSDKLGFDP